MDVERYVRINVKLACSLATELMDVVRSHQRKTPARSVSGLPFFISIRATPVTIITCSFGVCQCHGIEHPAGILAKMMEGPFDGSPLCTDPKAHVGSPGIVINFIAITLRPDDPGAAIRNNVESHQSS
jgi:hypothetical protein